MASWKTLSSLAVLGVTLLAGAPRAVAIPTTGTLSFTYGGTTGLVRGTHSLDERPSGICVFRVRATVHYEGKTKPAATKYIATRYQTRRKVNRFTIKIRNPLRSGPNGEDGILTLQAQSQCRVPGDTLIITSNAFARFVKCGQTLNSNSPRIFLNQIAKNFR